MADNSELTGQEILVLANALSLLIADDKSIYELVYLGTLISEIGSGILTIAAINRVRQGTSSDSITSPIISSNLISR